MFQKTLIIAELKHDIVMRVQVSNSRGQQKAVEVARFAKTGMGRVALGAAGRAIITGAMPDDIQFTGHKDTYDMLVGLGVIEPVSPARSAA
jgi:hypothetical protein